MDLDKFNPHAFVYTSGITNPSCYLHSIIYKLARLFDISRLVENKKQLNNVVLLLADYFDLFPPQQSDYLVS